MATASILAVTAPVLPAYARASLSELPSTVPDRSSASRGASFSDSTLPLPSTRRCSPQERARRERSSRASAARYDDANSAERGEPPAARSAFARPASCRSPPARRRPSASSVSRLSAGSVDGQNAPSRVGSLPTPTRSDTCPADAAPASLSVSAGGSPGGETLIVIPSAPAAVFSPVSANVRT